MRPSPFFPSRRAAILALAGAAFVPCSAIAQDAADPDAGYSPGPDHERRADVPKGKVIEGVFDSSDVFPGTIRKYWIYVPAQHDPEGSEAASLMVFQDGHAYVSDDGDFRAQIVFDNLIAAGDMPVTVGLFVNPGHKGDALPENPWRSSNRSFEYDTLSGDYAKFLVDELLPEVRKAATISDDPKARAICGMSSGGICAWTAAWERPDQFRKVLSHIGSFTNIRGGYVYPAVIRKSEPKPIRVLLQDGENDLDNEHGNWWLSNLQMAAALKFKDYDLKTEWGTGTHNGRHGGAIFPDSLRWLWRK